MIVLVKLILAHLIGDFLLQPKSWVEEKETRKLGSWKLYAHVIIHAVLVTVALGGIAYWKAVTVIAVTHGLIDAAKLQFQKPENRIIWFVADQLAHLTVLVLVWMDLTGMQEPVREFLFSDTLIIYATAILFLTQPTSILMSVLMQPWSKEISSDGQESLVNAGKYIGIVERMFVFCFIVIGQWQAVGFLLAAKSVFRFGNLQGAKERKLTEYVLIGTMLSFGLAIISGMLTVVAL